MKDNFKKFNDEVSEFYHKLEKLLLLQIKRFFGVTAEIIRKPTTTTATKTNNTTTTATAGGCITQNAPRPPNKKSIVILKGIDSKKALFHGDSRKQLFLGGIFTMKKLKKFNSAFDINGNSVVKAFYADNTTEIIRGGAVQDFYIRHGVKWNDRKKFYKSISGLRNSK